MAKTSAPYNAPIGQRWCSKHNEGHGTFVNLAFWADPPASYCKECTKAYQRNWEKTKRIRPPRIVTPQARLSKDESTIIIHLPNEEKGRNVTRQIFTYWPDVELEW